MTRIDTHERRWALTCARDSGSMIAKIWHEIAAIREQSGTAHQASHLTQLVEEAKRIQRIYGPLNRDVQVRSEYLKGIEEYFSQQYPLSQTHTH